MTDVDRGFCWSTFALSVMFASTGDEGHEGDEGSALLS